MRKMHKQSPNWSGVQYFLKLHFYCNVNCKYFTFLSLRELIIKEWHFDFPVGIKHSFNLPLKNKDSFEAQYMSVYRIEQEAHFIIN